MKIRPVDVHNHLLRLKAGLSSSHPPFPNEDQLTQLAIGGWVPTRCHVGRILLQENWVPRLITHQLVVSGESDVAAIPARQKPRRSRQVKPWDELGPQAKHRCWDRRDPRVPPGWVPPPVLKRQQKAARPAPKLTPPRPRGRPPRKVAAPSRIGLMGRGSTLSGDMQLDKTWDELSTRMKKKCYILQDSRVPVGWVPPRLPLKPEKPTLGSVIGVSLTSESLLDLARDFNVTEQALKELLLANSALRQLVYRSDEAEDAAVRRAARKQRQADRLREREAARQARINTQRQPTGSHQSANREVL